MKLSSAFHWVGRITGTLGALALIGAWIAGQGGAFIGLSQVHLYLDAITLTLLSIAALVCGLFYLKLELVGKPFF